MILEYDTLGNSITYNDRQNPYEMVGEFIRLLSRYDPIDPKKFFDELQFFLGSMQPLSEETKKKIKEKMMTNYKYKYIAQSYFFGATLENKYTPTWPNKLAIKEDENANLGRGFRIFYVKSGGADEYRSIVLRLSKSGFYFIWSDSFMNILDDIEYNEELSPWY